MQLSKRAAQLMQVPSQIVRGHMICAENPYSLSNPQGYLNFGVAQNFLVDDMILPVLNRPIQHTPNHIQYNELHGRKDFRDVLTHFLQEYLNIESINSDFLTLQCGVSAICESLAFAMFDEGDAILIPTPYYTGFEHDFTKRFKVKFLPAHLNPERNFTHQVSAFEKAYLGSDDKTNIKAVLLTDPHNPTGEILSESFKQDIITFCLDKKLSLISDEIYALSKHKDQKHRSLYQQAKMAGVDAHLLYGMAKDFAIAGLKVGLYYSENEAVVRAMQNLSYFHPISTSTQLLVGNFLQEDSFIKHFIAENRKRLAPIPPLLQQQLPRLKFIPTQAGLFFMLDLSNLCKSFKDEETLFDKLIHQYRLNISPGKSLGLSTPGYFRVCFAQRRESVLEFVIRMRKFCEDENL